MSVQLCHHLGGGSVSCPSQCPTAHLVCPSVHTRPLVCTSVPKPVHTEPSFLLNKTRLFIIAWQGWEDNSMFKYNYFTSKAK